MKIDKPELSTFEQTIYNKITNILDERHGEKRKRSVTKLEKRKILESLLAEHDKVKKSVPEKIYQSKEVEFKVFSNEEIDRETCARYLCLSTRNVSNMNRIFDIINSRRVQNRETYYKTNRVILLKRFSDRFNLSFNRIDGLVKTNNEPFKKILSKLKNKSWVGEHCQLIKDEMNQFLENLHKDMKEEKKRIRAKEDKERIERRNNRSLK